MGVGAGAGAGGGAIIVVVAAPIAACATMLFDINICERAAYPLGAAVIGGVAVEDGPEFWY